MRKADVILRSSNDYAWVNPVPALNVKWYPYLPAIVKKFKGTTATGPYVCAVCGQPRFFHTGMAHGQDWKATLAATSQLVTDHRFKPGGSYIVHEFGDDEAFWDWVERKMDDGAASEYPNGEFVVAEEIAREDGWERAQELADENWPERTVKVWSSGRSGGWLIVEGLPDIETWDAIAVARWARFEAAIRATVEDLDYQFVWHLHVNVYENLAVGFI